MLLCGCACFSRCLLGMLTRALLARLCQLRPPVTNTRSRAPGEGANVLVIGGSVSAGAGQPRNDHQRAWVPRLFQWIRTTFPHGHHRLVRPPRAWLTIHSSSAGDKWHVLDGCRKYTFRV